MGANVNPGSHKPGARIQETGISSREYEARTKDIATTLRHKDSTTLRLYDPVTNVETR
jgi:hypothetical protein